MKKTAVIGKKRGIPITLAALTAVSAAQANDLYFVGQSGSNWSNSANWSFSAGSTGGAPVPTSGDSVFIGPMGLQTDLVFFDGEESSPGLASLLIDSNSANAPTTFQQTTSNDMYVAGTETIGQTGTAIYQQSAGTNTAGSLNIFNAGSSYQLSGSASLSVTGAESVTGATFTQSGGTHTVGGQLTVDNNASYNFTAGSLSVGTDYTLGGSPPADNSQFTLSGTAQMSVTETEYISGSFSQYAGTTNTAGQFAIAYASGTIGSYDLEGGTLNGGVVENIGYQGTATFLQNGGTHNTSEMFLSAASGQTATYTMNAGNLNINQPSDPNDLYIEGYAGGIASFIHTGGTVTIAGALDLSHFSGASASYSLSGTGVLSAAAEYIGDAGTATFTQSTGTTNTANYMELGSNPGSSGTYTISGGTLNLNSMTLVDQMVVGNMGSGTLNVSGSAIINSAGNVEVGLNNGSSGDIEQTGGAVTLGSATVSAELFIGHNAGSTGVYNFSGSSSLTVYDDMFVGYDGAGAFTQTGGTVAVKQVNGNASTGFLAVAADGANSTGTYTLNSGSLSADTGIYIGAAPGAAGGGAGNLNILGGTVQSSMISVGSPGGSTVNQSAGTVTTSGTGSVYIAYQSGNVGTYNLSGGSLNVGGDFHVGIDNPANANFTLSGTGALSVGLTEYDSAVFTQGTGTTNTALNFYLGYNSGDNATYTLNDGTLTVNNSEELGYQGTASFIQNGGTHNGTDVFISAAAGQTSTYTINAGVFNVVPMANAGSISITGAAVNTATFVQTGGSVSVADGISLANSASTFGAYSLSGTGSLTSSTEYIGNNGTGVFTQSDTTTNTTNFIDIAANEGANGTYNMNGGTLTVTGGSGPNIFVGDYDYGSINQTAGSISVDDGLYLGRSAAGHGNYSLSGAGSLTAGSEAIGGFGSGLFTQTGGSNTVTGTLFVSSAGYPTNGTYDMQAGTLSAANLTDSAVFTQEIGSPAVTVTGSVVVANGGTYNLNAGTVNSANVDIGGNGSPSGSGVLGINGGALTVTNTLRVESTGTINLQSGSFNTVNLVNLGTINISGGTWSVSGTNTGGNINQTAGTQSVASGSDYSGVSQTVSGSTAAVTSSGSVSYGATAPTTFSLLDGASATFAGNVGIGNAGSLTTGATSGTTVLNVQGPLTAHEVLLGNTLGADGAINIASVGNVNAAGLSYNDLTITNGSLQIVSQPAQPGDDPEIIGAIVGGYQRDGTLNVNGGTVSSPVIKMGITTGNTGTYNQTAGTVTTGIFSAGNDASITSGTGTGIANISGGTLGAMSILVGSDAIGPMARHGGVGPLDAPTAGGTVTISGGATVTATTTEVTTGGQINYNGGSFSPGDLTLDGGGLMTVANDSANPDAGGITPLTSGSTPTVLVLHSLAITGSSSLDLANNDAVVQTTTLSTVESYLESGYKNGDWDGSGIISSAAAKTPSLTALAVELNAQQNIGTGVYISTPILTQFENITVALNNVLVKYTLVGDADLSGYVDTTDYTLIDNGFNSDGKLTGWRNGDFNYDGLINGDDFTLIDNSFNSENNTMYTAVPAGGQPAEMIASETGEIAGGATTVPEPGAITLLAAMSGGLLRRRRR